MATSRPVAGAVVAPSVTAAAISSGVGVVTAARLLAAGPGVGVREVCCDPGTCTNDEVLGDCSNDDAECAVACPAAAAAATKFAHGPREKTWSPLLTLTGSPDSSGMSSSVAMYT